METLDWQTESFLVASKSLHFNLLIVAQYTFFKN